MLELKNLNKIYHMKKSLIYAVNDVNLTFNRGEFVSILGYSGSGKTTLVSLIGGLEEPTNGCFYIDGIDTSTFKKSQWTDYRKNTIGFVFQDFNLIDHLSAIDNIKISLSLSGNSEDEKEKRACELLEMVSMTQQRDQFPNELSGGQQQRIAIARALANNPEIILADEPTGALDPKTSKQIMNLLQSLADKGHLVLMVTHNEKLANTYSSRIVEIEDGSIVKDTIIKDYDKKDSPVTQMSKSALELKTAFKVAFNNLKIRKKSSLFSLISLIPSFILVIVLGNFTFNISNYQEDITPIYRNIVNEETMHYVSKYDEKTFFNKMDILLTKISKKNYDLEIVEAVEAEMFEPYSEADINDIKNLPFVKDVFKNSYFDITIEGEHFILVGLLPELYKDYQYDFDFAYYPKDHEKGLIFSTEASKLLLGKYTQDPMVLENQSIQFSIDTFNSLPLHNHVLQAEKNIFDTKVLKIFDPKIKTTLMSNYYKGYIFAPYDYIHEIRDTFNKEDISLITYHKVDAISPEGESIEYYPTTYQTLTDMILPLRQKTMLQEELDLFSFREYEPHLPSNNFMMRHKIITNRPLNEEDLKSLEYFGTYYPTQYDDIAVYSAINTNDYINQLLLYAKISVAIIVTIPSVLVALILYISIILRTKEIGVLKSIGAKTRDITTIFTLESGILAFTSGFIAFFGSFPVLIFIRDKFELQYHITYSLGSNPLDINIAAVVISLVLIVLLITLLGILPGRKASKLHARVLLRKIN